MQSPRCEPQQIYKETSLSLRLNNLSAQHVILKTHIVRCLTNRTRLLKHFSPLDSFSKLKIGMLFNMKILFELGAKNEAWDFFSKYDQIRKKLRIWSHLLKKSLMENFIFCSVKAFERNRRTSRIKTIEIEIIQDSTPIPVDMSSFWGSSSKKTKFQQVFIRWLPLHSLIKVSVYLGGAHKANLNTCIKFEPSQDSATVESLYSEHEEADDRLLYHINHAIKEDHHNRVIVAPPDTDVFVCLVHHFNR